MSLEFDITKAQADLGQPYQMFDADGNILAHVTPRVDTLANLLLVSDAGDGEVATASDVDSRVVYRGDPSVGIEYNRAESLGMFFAHDASLIIPSGETPIQIEFDTITDERGYIDGTNNRFIGGKLEHAVEASTAITADIDITITGVQAAVAGTYVMISVEQLIGAVWTATGDYFIVPIIPVTGTLHMYHIRGQIKLPLTFNYLRFMAQTDDTAIIICEATTIVSFKNSAGNGFYQTLA